MHLPLRLLRPFLGRRILKTGLSVFVVLALFHWVGSSYATFGAVAAILAIQPTPTRARDVLGQQLIGNLIAGVVGAVLGYWLGPTALAMALATIIVLGICAAFRLTEAAGLAVTVVLFIMDRPGQDFLLYLLARLAVISTGMLVGYLVNRYLYPPDFTGRLKEELKAASEEVDVLGRNMAASLPEPSLYRKQDIKEETRGIQHRLESVRYFLDLLNESDPYNMRGLLYDRLRSSLFVFTERITDIHKIVLQAGGLRGAEEQAHVTEAFELVLRFKHEVMEAALNEGTLPRNAGEACIASLRRLDALVSNLVDSHETRDTGLALHSVLTNIRHMVWRLESLVRVLQQTQPTAN